MSTTKNIQTETSNLTNKAEKRLPSTSTRQNRKIALRSKHRFTYWENDRVREINAKPSLTIPDQTLSVRQIFENHRRNMPMPEVQVYYESQVGFTSEVYNMDKQDQIEFMRTVKANIDSAKQEYAQKMHEKHEREKQEAIELAKEQLIKDQAKQAVPL